MDECDSNSSLLRAVLLSHDPLVGARVECLCRQGWQIIRVATGFEAAAEILASPVTALLIDLRAMSDIHRRLLELAERLEVQSLAIVGNGLGTNEPALTHLRRVALEDIPTVLATMAAEVTVSAHSKAPEDPRDTHPDTGVYEPTVAPATQASTKNPAGIPPAARDEAPPVQAEEKRVLLTPKSKPPKTRQALLTAEELAALLEDEE